VRWSSWRVDSVLAGVAPGLAWQPAGGIVAVTLLLSWNCFISNCIYYNFSLARLAGWASVVCGGRPALGI
jgi:hypothetical protein